MRYCERPAPPKRAELSDNPIKFCNEIARLFRNRMRETEVNEGVMTQPGAHLVLSVLAINDGINQLELVKQTHLRAPTVSVILQKMEAEGIVERRKGTTSDKRAVLVYLTSFGRELDRSHIERIKKLDSAAMEGLSESEKETLMRILPKIRDNMLPKQNDTNVEGEIE